MSINPRPILETIKPYPAPAEGRYGKVRLDFNENTCLPTEDLLCDVPGERISAYPEYGEFLDKLSSFFAVTPREVLLTNGSDEALLLIALSFIDAGDQVLLSKPCFAVMKQTVMLMGADLREIPVATDYAFDIAGIQSALQAGVRIAMFATPENPTGAVLTKAQIESWCRQFPETLFVIDEAYAEYADVSYVPLIKGNPNLLVLKTFSKAWGMAGLRLGVVFGAPTLLDYIRRIKLPYSVNSAAVWAASKLLDRPEDVYTTAQAVMQRKRALEVRLQNKGFRLITGQSNSFLLDLDLRNRAFYDFARRQGVLIRYVESLNLLRVSIGSEAETTLFERTLEAFAGNVRSEVTI